MSKLTKEQEEKFLSLIPSDYWSNMGYGDFIYEGIDNLVEFLSEIFPDQTITCKCVDEWGGEGQGEDIGSVHHFPEIDLYIRIDGYYASHYGSDWDNAPYVVRPIDKVVTFYE